jgi:hypothetical protein
MMRIRLQVAAATLVLAWAAGCGRGSRSADRLDLVVAPPGAPPSEATRTPRLSRGFFPYSVVYGGVHSPAELVEAAETDPVVREHYKDIRRDRVHLARLTNAKQAYVSYRTTDGVYWTRKPVTLRAGEEFLTDGENVVRARCGNRVSEVARLPVMQEPLRTGKQTPVEPDTASFDAPLPAETVGSTKPEEFFGKASAPAMQPPIPGPLSPDAFTFMNSGGFLGVGGFSGGGGGGGGAPSGGSSSSSSTSSGGGATVTGGGGSFVGYNGFQQTYLPVYNSSSTTTTGSSSSTTTVTYGYTPIVTPQLLISWNYPTIPVIPIVLCCGLPPQYIPKWSPPVISNPPGSPPEDPTPPGGPVPPNTPPSPPPGSPPDTPPTASTPEPGLFLLLGAGLVLIGWFGIRRASGS